EEPLTAPGLCSYIAASCGGALGRVFLTHPVVPGHRTSNSSHLSVISEGVDESTPSFYAVPSIHPVSLFPEPPRIEHLEPADSQQQPVEWWRAMVRSSRVATGQAMSGNSLTKVPDEAVLGQGSYGLVWRAIDSTTGQLYAVKNITTRKRGAASVATRECDICDAIRLKPHPCIVRLFLVTNFLDAELYVLVQEFCPGGDLKGCIKKARQASAPSYRPPPLAMRWLAQIFLGLEHMHLEMDTLLRDLKPENVVLSASGCAKLTDFGFGRFGVESSGCWSFGMPSGSPGYVSPEVLHRESYDSRADLYSFGVLAWVMLTGGVTIGSEPVPPMGRPRYGGDFQAHFNDYDLLGRCLRNPESYRARRCRSEVQDFVARLTCRRPLDRMRHEDIRKHPFWSTARDDFQAVQLPANRPPEVERWIREVQNP
ncbi:unnamed protein product, partial [Polarella glacialis]